ncbi:hypothetical protein GC163_16435 [bacterium]|nr:hypothetical protein [bacterium]
MVGLVGAGFAWCQRGHFQVVDGVLEVTAPNVLAVLSRGSAVAPGIGISAITLGHVVLGRDLEALQRTRRHERVHVRQYECWGPFFIPTYLWLSGWMWLSGRHPYLDNPFEVEAYAVDWCLPDGQEKEEAQG